MRRPRAGRRARRWVVMILGLAVVTMPSLAHPHPKAAAPTVYGVRPGDTLGAIARRFGVSLRALMDANGIRHPDALPVGQRLVIPSTLGGRARPEPPARATAHPPANFVLTASGLDGSVRDFRWPLDGPISSPFGRRRSGWHAGIDIKADLGTPILSAAKGVVLVSSWERFYGRVVKIEHENGFMTVYAHNLQNLVEAGDEVRAGQVIATVGQTGRATTSHLHFEIRSNGKIFNPVLLLPQRELQFVADGESQLDDDSRLP